MDDISFRHMAVESAQRYLGFLEQEDKGIIITEVTSITKRGEEAFLHLRNRLSTVGIDALKLRIYADEYKSNVIHPVEYHRDRNVLVLHPEKEFYDRLPSGRCSHITIIMTIPFRCAPRHQRG